MITSISFFDSIIVSIVSMIVVFLSLIVIAFIINRLKLIAGDKKAVDNKPVVDNKIEAKDLTIEKNIVDNNEIINDELVAVVAAALASSLGLDVPDINIQSITRIQQNTTSWSDMGRNEQLFGKL